MGYCDNSSNPPRLLKDFLREDSISTHYSKPPQTKKLTPAGLLFRNMVNLALKSIKSSPSVLHTTLSSCRVLSRSSTITNNTTPPPKQATSVKQVLNFTVKDIIRWKSFRDLQEDEAAEETTWSSSSECSSSSSSSQSGGSKGTSWCESDFSSEWWWCQTEIVISQDLGHCKKSILLLPPPTLDTAGGENDKYHSKDQRKRHKNPFPTHVFQSEQEEDEYSCSNLLTNSESPSSSSSSSTDDSQSEGNDAIGGYEGVFAMAWELLDQVKSSTGKAMKGEEEELLLDFFTDELMIINRRDYYDHHKRPRDHEMMIMKEAVDWVNSKNAGSSDNITWGLGLERKNDGYVKAMDEEVNWSNFGGGHEVSLEVEAGIFDDLIAELLLHIS